MRLSRISGTAAAAAAVVVFLGGGFAGYRIQAQSAAEDRARAMTGGNPDAGAKLVRRYGCAGCHRIPGIRAPGGRVGPPLAGLSERVYIGGLLPNTPDNLIGWIHNPPAFDPKTAMPVTGISLEEARHVAAYLYSRD